MQLEMVSDPDQSRVYPYQLSQSEGQLIFDPLPMVDAIITDRLRRKSVAEIAGRFHCTLAAMIAEVCSQIRLEKGVSKVVLSGGVFQNCLLTEMTVASLENAGFQVLTHSLVPPNDGGLALGQAAVAAD